MFHYFITNINCVSGTDRQNDVTCRIVSLPAFLSLYSLQSIHLRAKNNNSRKAMWMKDCSVKGQYSKCTLFKCTHRASWLTLPMRGLTFLQRSILYSCDTYLQNIPIAMPCKNAELSIYKFPFFLDTQYLVINNKPPRHYRRPPDECHIVQYS